MKQWRAGIVAVLMCLLVQMPCAFAAAIRPVGTVAGQDQWGNRVYQVQANGIKIGYKLIGDGPALVMIAGLGNTMDIWPQELLKTLSGKFQLILLDNRGMGFTTDNGTPFTYQLFADDVLGLLDALHVQQADVLGFSMGSTITQELLLQSPSRFGKAVIYATSTDGSNVAGALEKKKPARAEQVNPTVLKQLQATTHWKTPMDRAAAITNQVMFIVGTADTVVGPESSKKLAAVIPGAWLVQFKNGSHRLMLESPWAFARIVFTFLETNETVEKKSSPHP